MLVRDTPPRARASTTQGAVSNSTTTYNQAGKTYNEAGLTYGGFYGNSDVVPIFSFASSPAPHLSVSRTQAQLENQAITYNEIGVVYNDSRYLYGGVFGQSDFVPVVSLSKQITPRITHYGDIYIQFVPPPPVGSSNGPGFFMFVNL